MHFHQSLHVTESKMPQSLQRGKMADKIVCVSPWIWEGIHLGLRSWGSKPAGEGDARSKRHDVAKCRYCCTAASNSHTRMFRAVHWSDVQQASTCSLSRYSDNWNCFLQWRATLQFTPAMLRNVKRDYVLGLIVEKENVNRQCSGSVLQISAPEKPEVAFLNFQTWARP